MKTNKSLIYSSFGIVLIFLLVSCGGNKKQSAATMQGAGMPKPVVNVITIEPQSYVISREYAATLEAYSIVKLRADVSGYLKSIKVQDGSFVHKGQVLYALDKSRYQAAYDRAKADLAQVKTSLALKQRDLERYQDLLKHDAISRQTVDQATTAVEAAQANLKAAEAAVESAATDLRHTHIIAPESGKLGIVQVKVGDLVSAGQTLINTIVNENPMYVDFEIPQSDIAEFTDPAIKRTYSLQFSDGSDYDRNGKLLVVNNAVDQTTGSIQIRLQFPNDKGMLKSGMSAVVLVQHPTDSDGIAVPTTALVHILAETAVYVLDKDNKIESRSVVTGPEVGNKTLIIKGLQPGDRIVVEGLKKVRPGMEVQVQPETQKGGNPSDSSLQQ